MRQSISTSLRTCVVLLLMSLTVVAGTGSASALQAKPVVRTGSLARAVEVPGGTTPKRVAGLPLTAGNWTVLAKGLFVNTTTAGTPRVVRCRLVLGVTADVVQGSPARSGLPLSTESFLLTGSAHLVAPTEALVRCSAPGSQRGDVVIRDLRMAAIRSSGLFIGDEGAAMAVFGSPGSAYVVYDLSDDAGEAFSSSFDDITGLDLPAGHWAMVATATFRNGLPGSHATAQCQLQAEADYDRVDAGVSGTGGAGDRPAIALQAVHGFGAPGTAMLSCRAVGGTGNPEVRDLHLVAFKLTRLVNQDLSDPYFAAFQPGEMPAAAAGFDDGPRSIVPGGTFHRVRHMSLGRGRWLIVGKGFVDRDDLAAGRRAITCRLGGSGSFDRVVLDLGPNGGPGELQPFELMWTGSFTTRSDVRLDCKSPVGTASSVNWLKLTAYRAGTLTSVAID